jgi:hypothetical protein
LARFALSAFGPATSVEIGDDYGIDLVCATARRVGKRLHVGPSYLVQVKSDDATEVIYKGDHVGERLNELGSPLLLCKVDKVATRIRLYSTWSLARVLLQLKYHPEPADTFRLEFENDVSKDQPKADAIPVGRPIVGFCVTQLHDPTLVKNLSQCIEEWVVEDTQNIVRRSLGLAIAKGYLRWETNIPPSSVSGKWYRPHWYAESAKRDARSIIADCATLLSLKGNPEEKKLLAEYVAKFCDLKEMDAWAKEQLGV